MTLEEAQKQVDQWIKTYGVRYFSDFPTYPFSKKKLIKGTKMEYAPIKQFTSKFYPCNFIDAIELAGYESFELLWNMKLYRFFLAVLSQTRLYKNEYHVSFYEVKALSPTSQANKNT